MQPHLHPHKDAWQKDQDLDRFLAEARHQAEPYPEPVVHDL